MADIGIDLGTTNSAVAYLRNTPEIIENEGRQTTPSVVAWDEDEMLVGQSAKDMAMVLPSAVSVKRDMGTDKTYELGGKTYTPVAVSAMILKALKEAAEKRLEEPIDSAVITIPAYFHGAQKEATKQAGEEAGLKAVRLLAEPIAAALSYGAEDTVLVYDLGGGTFDVAIIDCFDLKMLSLDGDNYLGGDDFDNRLMSHLGKAVKEQAGVDIESEPEAKQKAKAECERAKIELSVKERATIVYQPVISGKPVNVRLKVTREQFEGLIMDLVDRTIEKVASAIAKATENDKSFSKDTINTVLLVGGSTYIPVVQRRLAEYFGREPSHKVNPDLAVALGAAVHTAAGPVEKGTHRLTLDPVDTVTPETEVKVKGRTSPGAQVQVTGGAAPVSCTASESGRFTFTIELVPGKINTISVVATSTGGEERKGGFEVRHDATFSGIQQAGRRKSGVVGGGLLPRSLGIRLGAQDDRLGVLVPADSEIPLSVKNDRDFGMRVGSPNTPGYLMIELYEGDLPFAPLNTLLGTVRLETPPVPSTEEPLEFGVQVTEDHLVTVTARLVNFPDRMVTAKLGFGSPSGGKLHVLELAERVLRIHKDKLRPEEKAKLNKSHQGLKDLCQQFEREETPERYQRIRELGEQLRADLDRIEGAYGV